MESPPPPRKRLKRSRNCSAFGCLNSKQSMPELSFFSLPKETARRREWLELIGREDLLRYEDMNPESYSVCSVHFNELNIETLKRLKTNAVPTEFLGIESSNISPSTSSSTITEDPIPTDNSIHNESKVHIPSIASSNLSPSVSSATITITEVPKPIDNSIDTESKVQILSNIKIREASRNKKSIKSQTELAGSSGPSEVATQTTKALAATLPQYVKLWTDLKDSERKRRKLQNELDKIKQEIEANNAPIELDTEDEATRRFQKLIQWQNKLRRNKKGNRYDAEYKVFALNLHYCSPLTYRCLQTVLNLPSRSTLNRFKLKIPPKLDARVLDSLAMKIKSLPEKARYCSICVDKMALKHNLCYGPKTDELIGFHNVDGKISPELASYAYVIMLQGIHYDWKQPIAYALLASTEHYVELDAWMNKVIRSLFGVGIEIKAVISNQESNFDEYAKVMKQVTVEKPYFYIDDRKVYYVFDVPHLLKCVRNHLLSSNFYYEGKHITWDYIKTLYEDEKEKNLRLIPKLTDAHIEPNNKHRKKLKYAAQIFSYSVYAALETYIDFGKITEAARATAQFIKTMDSVFDVLNSNKEQSDKKLQTAFRMSQDQKTVLDDAQNMFANIKSVDRNTGKDNTNQIQTFVNFQISIGAVQQLFQDLRIEGFNFLFTRRLNQDSLEECFGRLRQQGGCFTEPTSIKFTKAFSKIFFMNMLTSSPSADCETDIYKILLKAEDIMKTRITRPEAKIQPSLVSLEEETDYRIDLPEENAVPYVAAYLTYKCAKVHNCDAMNKALDSVPGLDQCKLFAQYKAYNKKSSFYGGLRIPPQYVIQYVEQLEGSFAKNFDRCVQNRPGSAMFQILNVISPVKMCECFPIDYFLKLFIRLRICATLKFNNRLFESGKKSIQQYLVVKHL